MRNKPKIHFVDAKINEPKIGKANLNRSTESDTNLSNYFTPSGVTNLKKKFNIIDCI